MENYDIVTINQAVRRSKAEGIPVAETALRRWVKDGTLHATYAGRKALIYWPDLVKLLCGESALATNKRTYTTLHNRDTNT